jgi:hypothetical protein
MTSSSSSLPLTPTSPSLVAIKDSRYQRGKIYQIVVLHEDYKDDLYVGSTISRLSQRFGEHKINAEQDDPTKKLHVLMKDIGMRFFKIVLIEDWPCDSKEELCKREQYHMGLMKPTLNMKKAHRTEDEKKAYNKDYYTLLDYYKGYYEKNKKKILALQKERKAKVKLSYREKVVLAFNQAIRDRAGRP